MSTPTFTSQPPMGSWEKYASALEQENLHLKQLLQESNKELQITKNQCQMAYATMMQAQRGHSEEKMRAENLQFMLTNSHQLIFDLQSRLGTPVLSARPIATGVEQTQETCQPSLSDPVPEALATEQKLEVDRPPQESGPETQVDEQKLEADRPSQTSAPKNQIDEPKIEVVKPFQDSGAEALVKGKLLEMGKDQTNSPPETAPSLKMSSEVVPAMCQNKVSPKTNSRWRHVALGALTHKKHVDFKRFQSEREHRVAYVLPNWKRLASAVYRILDWTLSDTQKRKIYELKKSVYLAEIKVEIGQIQAGIEKEMAAIKTSISTLMAPESPVLAKSKVQKSSQRKGNSTRTGKPSPYAFFMAVLLEGGVMQESLSSNMQSIKTSAETESKHSQVEKPEATEETVEDGLEQSYDTEFQTMCDFLEGENFLSQSELSEVRALHTQFSAAKTK